jgi:hypothetical protein
MMSNYLLGFWHGLQGVAQGTNATNQKDVHFAGESAFKQL